MIEYNFSTYIILFSTLNQVFFWLILCFLVMFHKKAKRGEFNEKGEKVLNMTWPTIWVNLSTDLAWQNQDLPRTKTCPDCLAELTIFQLKNWSNDFPKTLGKSTVYAETWQWAGNQFKFEIKDQVSSFKAVGHHAILSPSAWLNILLKLRSLLPNGNKLKEDPPKLKQSRSPIFGRILLGSAPI